MSRSTASVPQQQAKKQASPSGSSAGAAALRRKRRWAKIWNCRTAYLMLIPCLVSLLIFNYLPMFGLQIAFKNYRLAYTISEAKWVGLKWFRQFFASAQCLRVVKNTLSISLMTLIVGFPLPILLALIINELRSRRMKKTLQTVTYMPYFVSSVIIVTLVTTIFGSNGVVNSLRMQFGADSPLLFMQDSKWFKPIYMLMGIWQYTGYDAIVFVGAMAAIPPELYEAALIDGAGRFSRMWHITVRCIMPTIATMFILKVGKIMNLMWQQILLMQNDLNIGVSEVIQTYVYKRGIESADYSFATAVGMLTSLFSLVLIVSTNYITKKMSDNEVSVF